jgi:hypothetical protein
MEAVSTCEMLVSIYHPTPCSIPEDSHLHACCCENLKSHSSNHLYIYISIYRGIFVTELAGTLFLEVISQKDTSLNGVLELFSGIGISNANLRRPNFGSLYVFQNFFKEK